MRAYVTASDCEKLGKYANIKTEWDPVMGCKVELTNKDIRGSTFSGSFKNSDFTLTNLNNVIFEDSFLFATKWNNLNLQNSTFRNVSMRRAVFDGANLSNTVFSNVNLCGAEIDDPDLQYAINDYCVRRFKKKEAVPPVYKPLLSQIEETE